MTGNKAGGFTLIELMIVVAIVGILAAIALPAYQDYIVRSKMAEPMAALTEARVAVAEYVAQAVEYPDSINDFGVLLGASNSDILWGLQMYPEPPVDGGTIYIGAGVYTSVWTGGEPDPGSLAVVQLSGSTNAEGEMVWDCISGWTDAKLQGIPIKFLPATCRG